MFQIFFRLYCIVFIFFSLKSYADENQSFKAVLLDDTRNQKFVETLGKSCVVALQKVWNSGGNLNHPEIQKNITQMRKIHFPSGEYDNSFYHLTSHPGLKKLFQLKKLSPKEATDRANQENIYEEMLRFLRTESTERVSKYPMWYRSLYLSEDPTSVYEHYYEQSGLYQIEFTIDMNAKIFNWNEDALTTALNDLGETFPEIKNHCDIQNRIGVPDTYAYVTYHPLFFIILDDNDVDFSNYNQGNHWFQAIKTRSFKSVRLTQKFLGKSEEKNPYIFYKDDQYRSSGVDPSQQDGTLLIQTANYGETDITDKVSAFCNGKSECHYKLSHYYVFDDAKKVYSGDFKLKYSCIYKNNKKLDFEINFAEPAENQIANLLCAPE